MPTADGARPRGRLESSVLAGECGPVVVLSGEADFTSLAQLSTVISGQLAGGTRQLTIDVSGLRFADTASIRALILAAKALRDRSGNLVLLHPQPTVAKVLALLGADQMFTILTRPGPGPVQNRRS